MNVGELKRELESLSDHVEVFLDYEPDGGWYEITEADYVRDDKDEIVALNLLTSMEG